MNKLLLNDLLTLCKPKVVVMMLLTTWVGMFLANGQLSAPVFLFTTLGVGLSGGAAAVINHLVDRHLDATMTRTAHRPLASGRIKPSRAILFALFLGFFGLLFLQLFVNTLTMILTLLTLGGYAVLYTIFLKRATPQNIVIGGLAGALPPLLGWVAVSNSIHPHALILVLIIFAWTPPHFWALAIYRREDYEKAKIPMLPVTHGVAYTKLSIVLYTVLLILTTLLPFITQMSGILYACSAVALGLYFLWMTLQLYRSQEKDLNKIALKTFRFSIVYLLLLFTALFVDRFLQTMLV